MGLLFVYKVQVRVKSVGVSSWYSVTFFLAYLLRVANTDPRKCIYCGSFNREIIDLVELELSMWYRVSVR